MSQTEEIPPPNGGLAANHEPSLSPSADGSAGNGSDHVVHFYEQDDLLCAAVVRFIADGLKDGDLIVLIATEAHQGAFRHQLARDGYDVQRLQEAGRLNFLDAQQTLAQFMRAGRPDAELFAASVGAMIAKLVPSGASRLRAYGEMVDVLWQAGERNAAIRLEELWNDLQDRHSFTLLCGYAVAGFYKEAGRFQDVCASHTHVLEDPGLCGTPSARPTAQPPHHVRRLEQEIRRREEVEAALRDSLRELRSREEQLHDFVENGMVGLHRVGPDGTILWANRAELELLGYCEEEYVGRSIADFHVDRLVIDDILARLSRGESLDNYEARLRTKDGSVKNVLISSNVHRRDGEFIHTRCFTRDITERRKTGEALRQSEHQLRSITDAVPLLIASIDTEQRYRFVNASYEHWFGQPRAQILGKHMEEVLGGDAYAAIRHHVERALAGSLTTFEADVSYRDGGPRSVEATYVPQLASDGMITGFVAIVADVSAKKASERARAAAVDRAGRLLKITAAIADAVSSDEVFAALVDHVGEAVGASSAALWLVDDSGKNVQLVRARGYSEAARQKLAFLPIDLTPSIPALDCLRTRQAVWIGSQVELLDKYPHVASVATPGRSYRVSCLPLMAHGRSLGALGITIDESCEASDGEREFLLLVARYATQAVERLQLFEAERRSRADADAAANRLEVLSRASQAFAGSDLDLDSRLEAVVGELTTALSGRVNVALVEPDGLFDITAVHQTNPDAQGVPAYARIGAPLRVQGRVIGTVTASRVREGETYTQEDLRLLEQLADRAATVIESSRLYDETLRARLRAEQLYRFAQAVVEADKIETVFEAALSSIEAAVGATRAAILTFDNEGVMRFKAWHHLSDTYRQAVDGHSPWSPDAANPEPVLVADASTDSAMASYAALFRSEGIGALAFVPLVTAGKLLGKFMIYYDEPHAFASHEVETARAIANHLASVITRFRVVAKLEDTIRYNELFTGVLAHDLRNPLGAITMAAQLLLMHREGEDGQEGRDAKPLSRILSSGKRMTTMIDQLLDLTRARSGGGIDIQPRATNLAELCEQAVGELELAYPEWRIHSEVCGDQGGSWDAERLVQAISNLVANAGQHGERDGGIRIKLDGTLTEAVVFEIRNKGAISEPLLANLFDPFRGTRQSGRQTRGLGLGLFIVREIVRAHGGTIEVASTDPAGTTFTIRLPRHARRPSDGRATELRS